MKTICSDWEFKHLPAASCCPHGASESYEIGLILAPVNSSTINLWHGVQENVGKNGAVNAWIFSTI